MSRFILLLGAALLLNAPFACAQAKAFSEADHALALEFFSQGGFWSFRIDAPRPGAPPIVLLLMDAKQAGKIAEVKLGTAEAGPQVKINAAVKVLDLYGAGQETLRTFLGKFATGIAEGKFAAFKLKTVENGEEKISTAGAEPLTEKQLLELAGIVSEKEPTQTPLATPTASKGKPAKNRTWVDVTGKHKTVAKILELKEGRVRLLKTNGKTVSMPLDQLSEADRQYVEKWLATPELPAAKGPESATPDQKPLPVEEVESGPPKKGRSWSSVNDVEVNGEQRRPGKRFVIWPTTDEPLKIEGGKITVHLSWQVASDGMPPTEAKQDGIMLSVFIVSKTARLFRGKAVSLESGGASGEVERTESLEGDIKTADVYLYFSHDEIDSAKKKLVSTPLSNILRIKAGGR